MFDTYTGLYEAVVGLAIVKAELLINAPHQEPIYSYALPTVAGLFWITYIYWRF
jgi:hypothetical protein